MTSLFRSSTATLLGLRLSFTRSLSQSLSVGALKANKLPPRPKLEEHEFTEKFIKGGGPGGQKINKTNSKVQLQHIKTGIVVECQESRSRDYNRKRARINLALKVQAYYNPEDNREFIVKEWKKKKVQSSIKKSKQKHKKHAQEREEREELERKAAAEKARWIDPDLDYEILEYLPEEERERILKQSREKMERLIKEEDEREAAKALENGGEAKKGELL